MAQQPAAAAAANVTAVTLTKKDRSPLSKKKEEPFVKISDEVLNGKVSLKARLYDIFDRRILPKFPLIVTGMFVLFSTYLIHRGTMLSAIVGVFCLIFWILFMIVIVYQKNTVPTQQEISQFLDDYYSGIVSAEKKPDINVVPIFDVYRHVGQLLEKIPEQRALLLINHKREDVEKWEKPLRQWLKDLNAKSNNGLLATVLPDNKKSN